MKTNLPYAPTGIHQVASRIFATGRITREDEQQLHSVMMSDSPVSADELSQIRNVLDRLQMGLLKVAE